MVPLVAHLFNFALATLFWLIVGRFALKVISGGRTTFISEVFRRGTDPWFGLVRRITPGGVSDRHIPILGLLLIVNLRLFLSPLL